MKKKPANYGILGAVLTLGVLLTQATLGQTNLQFTSVSATDEGDIHLAWLSISNEVYEIDEADALIDTNTGSITWNTLYDDYPSQGTNTFWLDAGNYSLVPQILNPKDMPMRFYRVVDLGPDTTSDEPIVSITSPATGAAVTGEISVTVVAATDQPVLSGTKLYVDGQEMPMAGSISNYVNGSTNCEVATFNINTCEWGNETHLLFATGECQSGDGGLPNSPPVYSGHAVSPFVSLLFSNLVTRISFSQPSFDPSLGQTQQVSAVFAAMCNWMLQILDINSNVVQSATGSGASMFYNWDGTGTGETNLPNGVYFYYISAQTNGQAEIVGGGGGTNGFGSPPAPDFASQPSQASQAPQLWALGPDAEVPVPLLIYPPGYDTNTLTIFAASPSDIAAIVNALSGESAASIGGDTGFSPEISGGGSTAPSQNAPPAPQRPPTNPVKGLIGSFGVCYDTYAGKGSNGYLEFVPKRRIFWQHQPG